MLHGDVLFLLRTYWRNATVGEVGFNSSNQTSHQLGVIKFNHSHHALACSLLLYMALRAKARKYGVMHPE